MPEQVIEQDQVAEKLPASEIALGIAARCWCDKRTENRTMDSELATVFAEKIDEYINALRWCGGSRDFQADPDGIARVGWEKIVQPLIR